jgi:integrase
MTGMGKRIGLKEVRALKPGEIVWDAAVAGFHARRQKTEAVSYIVTYRTAEGRQRWQTIGRHGSPWTPDAAREAAKRILGEVASGADPAAAKHAKRKAMTVSELCDDYLKDAESGRLLTRRKVPKKAGTIATDRGRIERHIKPLLGSMRVGTVTREDVDRFLHDVAAGKTKITKRSGKKRGLVRVQGGKGTATRTVGLLGAIFAYAVRHRVRTDNPVHGVTRFADGKRERRLSDAEYKMLGNALKAAEARKVWPAASAAVRFLALTGWRSGEALGLKWSEIDIARRTATLPDTKTGRSVRPLSQAACAVLVARGRGKDDGLVFPATRGKGRMTGFPKLWAKIARLGEIPPEITPHTLRHSFASLGADLGYAEATIGALVGHKGHTITSRYIHSADAVLLVAADSVADRTDLLMGNAKTKGVVVDLRKAGF